MTSNAKKDPFEETMEKLVERFKSAMDYERPTISEALFFEKYLPLFAYRPGDTTPRPVMDWLEISDDNPYKEVNVVSPSGEVLFTVPPLLDRTQGEIKQEVAYSLDRVMRIAQQKNKDMPGLGNKHLDQLLEGSLVPANINTSFIERWNKIYERYDLPTIDLSSSKSNKGTDNDIEEMVFEDF